MQSPMQPAERLSTPKSTGPCGAETKVVNSLNKPSIAHDWRDLMAWWQEQGLATVKVTRSILIKKLSLQIAALDKLLEQQLDLVLHHQGLQKLEASWRGLHYLVDQASGVKNIKIRLLNISWQELARDMERALEFDQSELFKKVYTQEFDMPGGEPFGVLLGDYYLSHRITRNHPTHDIAVLEGIRKVAAAAFAPFICSIKPDMLGLESFLQLERPLRFYQNFAQAEYLHWKSFQESEDSRFIGLVLPHILLRLPYQNHPLGVDDFCKSELPSYKDYLWGNACYAYGAVLIQAFAKNNWLGQIRGIPTESSGGGLVKGLPKASFEFDKTNLAIRPVTNVSIPSYQANILNELGFIPLLPCRYTQEAVFYYGRSVQKPKNYDRPGARENSILSSMLAYMFCTSRFAHYIKLIARNKIGAYLSAEELENYLQRWILNYITSSDDISAELKAKYPLREARISVRHYPAKPGSYLVTVHILPHFELEYIDCVIVLNTEIAWS